MERVVLKVEVVKNRTHLNPPLEREDFLCRGRIKRNNLNPFQSFQAGQA
jgi:hypothetical protein